MANAKIQKLRLQMQEAKRNLDNIRDQIREAETGKFSKAAENVKEAVVVCVKLRSVVRASGYIKNYFLFGNQEAYDHWCTFNIPHEKIPTTVYNGANLQELITN